MFIKTKLIYGRSKFSRPIVFCPIDLYGDRKSGGPFHYGRGKLREVKGGRV